MISNKEAYISFCNSKICYIPIYGQAWWLDIVCDSGYWDVAITKKNSTVVGAMPYFVKKKFFFTKLTMPDFTQKLGPYLIYPDFKRACEILSFEKEVYSDLISQFPQTHFFRYNLDTKVRNWLPFKWKGFSQTTTYSYTITDTSDLVKIYDSYSSNIKGDIKKAQKKLTVKELDDVSILTSLLKKVFQRQHRRFPYSIDKLRKLDVALRARKQCKLFAAIDSNESIHAAVYLVWDEKFAYFLLSGADPSLRNSGATSLLVHHSISYSSSLNLSFDFEGSSVESIERFFRAFSPEQTFIHSLYKSKICLSRFFRLPGK